MKIIAPPNVKGDPSLSLWLQRLRNKIIKIDTTVVTQQSILDLFRKIYDKNENNVVDEAEKIDGGKF